jgi:hypothetical protein
LAHIFHAVVAGAINLDHVETVACGYLPAVVAFSAWRDRWAFDAIERLRQYPSGRRFADAAWADKEIGVGKPTLRDGILQGARNVRLPDQIIESLWPVFSRKDFVTHTVNLNALIINAKTQKIDIRKFREVI